MEIVIAKSASQIDETRRLFREYEAELNVDLCFQQFESELAALPGKYAPPSGVLILAMDGQTAMGCGAVRRLGSPRDRRCEMKRLYVRPEARGLGLGNRIARRLIREAIRMGYKTMALDTLERLKTALRLYDSLEFVRTAPYYDNPLEGVVYLELELKR